VLKASAYVSALTLIAKLHGKLTDKHQVTGKDESPLFFGNPEDLTDAQLIGIITKGFTDNQMKAFHELEEG
jgi:hypothetical protein